MENVLGIIAEYNPFHNGHLYHFQKSKNDTNSKFSIAVISGNFTQRGIPSIIDKWSKARMALSQGIDLVIELPLIYSISSAENFADGAIKILNSINIVNNISFGIESQDSESLNFFADILYNEPKEFKKFLSYELSLGHSFPKARENAMKDCFPDKDCSILSMPNNILAIEYLKALKKYNSKIEVNMFKRFRSEHNSMDFYGNIASSTAIRNLMNSNNYIEISNLIPQDCFSILKNKISLGEFVSSLNCFEKEIIYIFRTLSLEEIRNLPDVSEGLEFSIKNAAYSCNNLNDFFNHLKSKRYTQTRIQRILLYGLLHISKNDMAMSKSVVPYIRVLGFNENGKYLLSKIKEKQPDIKIVTSVKKSLDNLLDLNLISMLNKDIFATNVYTLAYKNNSHAQIDFTSPLVIF